MTPAVAVLLVVLLAATAAALPRWGLIDSTSGYLPAAALFVAFLGVLLMWVFSII